MKTNSNNQTHGRYRFLLILITLLGTVILGKAIHTMLPPNSKYWEEVDKRFTKENITIPPHRGNLLSDNGTVLCGSVPEYWLCLDFKVVDPNDSARIRTERWRDKEFKDNLDSMAIGLAEIFPDKSANWFRQRLEAGKKRGGFAYRIYPKHATYIQYMQCKQLPFLRESTLLSGFHGDPIMQRKKPYGSLASRTLGEFYRDIDSAKCGLEESFDSILRGKPGLKHRSKVRNARVDFIDREPQDGHDLMTTIDINIQDVADRSLRNKLYEVGGEVGVAIVMEVKTGDVKAIVNLTRGLDGNYYEMKNNAVSDLMEPGSTFKTASIMVALEDGKISKDTRVDTGNGVYMMHGRPMKDHNWRKGGYGNIDVTDVLKYSSNIGVSRLIDEHYRNDPDAFVCGLNRLGVGLPLDLPFKGKGEPRVRHPKKNGRYWVNWSNTALPWMSIGYETMLPPISTLAFYNGIANGGKLVKPRFVTAELQDGVVVREYPTEVLIEQMCKPSTLADIQDILEKVVSKGLGSKAGNGGRFFKVSGKTGTAQIASNGGYHNGQPRYMVSFCGYFPSDAPKYSCIVCITKSGLPASGGGQAGPVFSEISQYVMSKGNSRNADEAADSTSVFVPVVSQGYEQEAKSILKELSVSDKDVDFGSPDTMSVELMPDLTGVGARDAVYELQKRGLKVRLHGKGRVKGQNILAGAKVEMGKTVTLTLEE